MGILFVSLGESAARRPIGRTRRIEVV